MGGFGGLGGLQRPTITSYNESQVESRGQIVGKLVDLGWLVRLCNIDFPDDLSRAVLPHDETCPGTEIIWYLLCLHPRFPIASSLDVAHKFDAFPFRVSAH